METERMNIKAIIIILGILFNAQIARAQYTIRGNCLG